MALTLAIGVEYTGQASSVLDANRLYISGGTCAFTGKITEVGARCFANANYHLGLYDDSGGNPNNLLFDSGSIAATSGANATSACNIDVTDSDYLYVTALSDTGNSLRRTNNGTTGDGLYKDYAFDSLPDPAGPGYLAYTANKWLTFAKGYPLPSISSVDGDNTVTVGQTGVTLAGLNLLDSAGNVTVEFCDNANYGSATKFIEQTFNSQTDTTANIDIVQGTLSLGTVYAFVITGLGQRNTTGFSVTLQSSGNTMSMASSLTQPTAAASFAQNNGMSMAATLSFPTASADFSQANALSATAELAGPTASADFSQANTLSVEADIAGPTVSADFSQANEMSIVASLSQPVASATFAEESLTNRLSMVGVLGTPALSADFSQAIAMEIVAALSAPVAQALFVATNPISVAASLTPPVASADFSQANEMQMAGVLSVSMVNADFSQALEMSVSALLTLPTGSAQFGAPVNPITQLEGSLPLLVASADFSQALGVSVAASLPSLVAAAVLHRTVSAPWSMLDLFPGITATLIHPRGSYVAGRWVAGVPTTSTVYIKQPQPANGKDLQQVPEGERNYRHLKTWIPAEVFTGDLLTYGGENYKIVWSQHWVDPWGFMGRWWRVVMRNVAHR